MNPNPDIIEISSNSTKLNNVQPPRTFKLIPGDRTKEQARKKNHDVNAPNKLPTSSDEDLSHPPCYVYDSIVDDDTSRLEKVIQLELEKAASSFR